MVQFNHEPVTLLAEANVLRIQVKLRKLVALGSPIRARPTNGAGDEPQSVTARVKTISSITLSRRLVPALTATRTTMASL